MRDLNDLNNFRLRNDEVMRQYGWAGDGSCGVFVLPYGGRKLMVIASNDSGWDHVSVSLAKRCPTWDEMDFIKRRFFWPAEVVMQLHVAESNHINCHPYTLHLWRPHGIAIPLPPASFV